MPDIQSVVDIFANEVCNIEHEEGQVILLQFWSMNSKECETSMKNFNNMMGRRGAQWGDNVRVIALSVDQYAHRIVPHVIKNKWNKL